jgi:hypothetical protein
MKMNKNQIKDRLGKVESTRPLEVEDGLPKRTIVFLSEWKHENPEIYRSLPKRGYAGEKVRIFMFNLADSVEIFDGESNIKLVKCGWCEHLARDCDGANYLKFNLESIAKTRV